MARAEHRPADRSGRLVEEHTGSDPRVQFFHYLIAGLLLVLAGGLAYRQLIESGAYNARERLQNQRRVVLPGPRGNIYDRNGRILVEDLPQVSVALYLDELQPEFRRAFLQIRKNYRASGDRDLPSAEGMAQIARTSVVQRYLDQVDALLGRSERVDARALERHYEHQLFLPYTLIPDLKPEEFARLQEGLPVDSPLQFPAVSVRHYPYGSVASHVLGYVSADDNVDTEEVPGEDLKTFKLKGAVGRDGLEKSFDAQLQGEAGGDIFQVDPAGFEIKPPLVHIPPRQGKSLTTSLDVDLQMAAERGLGDHMGAAVALDVRTGEVLVMASKPDYDLNLFSPRLTTATVADLNQRKAWTNLAIAGLFAPGSTFKTVVSVAGMKSGRIDPEKFMVDCEYTMRIGNRPFGCENGKVAHGELTLTPAIAESCDIFFYTAGLATGPERIAAEARLVGLDRPTGIELPNESHAMIVPDAAWKRKNRDEPWTDGDTANTAIGQGFLRVTPLQMACWAASLARGETVTVPTLVHDPDRPAQHTEPLGLTPEQRAALVDGMIGCTTTTFPHATASLLTTIKAYQIPGVAIAGKTGTAQVTAQHTDIAWFICFAPADNPQIAVAVTVQGAFGQGDFGGAQNSAPVADAILQAYFRKHPVAAPAAAALRPGSPASARTAGSPAAGSTSPGA
ncbi:MAG TPA: penicillin-binding transpeptidase domain-containing protein [Opitutaceae bacterium]|nr:penicillin-binding transpeptidase domain-containing protein [Opitutaceae bacterium]